MSYSLFGIIPLIATVIGLIILEFKLKVPWYAKLLLPFTYFIFYQYTIVARSYCLIFPTLCYIAMIYPNRREKPIAYGLGLLILSAISLHTSLLSGFLFLLYLGEYIARRWKEQKNLSTFIKEKKVCIVLSILAIVYCFIIITVMPKDGVPIFIGNENVQKGEKALQVIGGAMISSTEDNTIINVFSLVLLMMISAVLVKRAKEERKIIILFFPLILFLVFAYCNQWHIGILTETIFFIWYILSLEKEPSDTKKKVEEMIFHLGIGMILLIHVLWNFQSVIWDISNIYAQGENMANYLKQPVEENKVIYGIDYSVTALLPYYETNIFANHPDQNKSFFDWSKDSGRIEEDEKLYEANADIYVFSEVYYPNREEIIRRLEEKGYQIKRLSSFTYIKNEPYEFSGYIFLVRKGETDGEVF